MTDCLTTQSKWDEGGRLVTAFSYVTDIMPNLLEMAGVERPIIIADGNTYLTRTSSGMTHSPLKYASVGS